MRQTAEGYGIWHQSGLKESLSILAMGKEYKMEADSLLIFEIFKVVEMLFRIVTELENMM